MQKLSGREAKIRYLHGSIEVFLWLSSSDARAEGCFLSVISWKGVESGEYYKELLFASYYREKN